jgi:sigma-B regulation protein RsbU (phosphoserine phosphatase)
MINILLIDDDPVVRLLLSQNLKKHGYRVWVAKDGKEGLERARQIQPALIICDWLMPNMDGVAVCQQIKSDPFFSATFFILLTSRTDVEDRIQGLDAGADEFLSKPVDPNELRARVRAGLRLYQMNQALQEKTHMLLEELSQAERYVRSLLPPPQVFAHTIKTDWRFIPSQQLGGDIFNYHWLDPDHLAFYLLDVSGHGVGAALLSVSLTNVLRSQSLSDVNFRHPSQVLDALNVSFQMSEHNGMFFTIWYGVYQLSCQKLAYASAGHPPAVITSLTGSSLLRTANPGVGILDHYSFTEDSWYVTDPSCLYLYSDGIYEILNSQDQLWGLDSLLHHLSLPEDPQESKLDQILRLAYTFQGTQTFSDDCSLLQIKFFATQSDLTRETE